MVKVVWETTIISNLYMEICFYWVHMGATSCMWLIKNNVLAVCMNTINVKGVCMRYGVVCHQNMAAWVQGQLPKWNGKWMQLWTLHHNDLIIMMYHRTRCQKVVKYVSWTIRDVTKFGWLPKQDVRKQQIISNWTPSHSKNTHESGESQGQPKGTIRSPPP